MSNGQNYFERGAELAMQGEYAKAIEIISKGLDLEPNDFEAIANRSTCHAQLENFPEALKDADRMIALRPNSGTGYWFRANILAEMGLPEGALSAFDTACVMCPDEPAVFHGRGNVHSETGHPNLALADFDRAITLDSQFHQAYLGRAQALVDLDLLNDAVEAYKKLIAVANDDSSPYVVDAEKELTEIMKRLRDRGTNNNANPATDIV